MLVIITFYVLKLRMNKFYVKVRNLIDFNLRGEKGNFNRFSQIKTFGIGPSGVRAPAVSTQVATILGN